MKTLFTKFVSSVVALAFIASFVPSAAFADDVLILPEPEVTTITPETTPNTGENSSFSSSSFVAPFTITTWYVSTTGSDSNDGRSTPDAFATLGKAVSVAQAGDTIQVLSGTHTLSSAVTLNQAVTIEGVGNPVIQVSGIDPRINILTSGVTIQDLSIQKTDKAGEQNIIYIGASNTTIQRTKISGQYVIGEGDVSRAMVFTGGLSNVTITNNEIYGLRQPAYISGVTTGTISNNYVHGTKGWVIEEGNMTFTNNTWGTGADANVVDIAIIPTVNASYYTDIVALSNANNGAEIEDQRTSPRVLSIVYVDAAAAPGGDGTTRAAYQDIQSGINRVATGGTVKVAAGTYTGSATINKSLMLKGAQVGTNASTRAGSETILDGQGINSPLAILASNVTVDGLTVTGGAGGYNSGIYLNENDTNVTLQNNILRGNVIGVYGNCGTGCSITNNLFDGNNLPGAAGGAGIYSEKTTSLTIGDNEFKNHLNNSAVVIAATTAGAHTGLMFSGNKIHDNNNDNSMVYVVGLHGGTFTGNEIHQSGTTALKFAGDSRDITVTSNNLTGNTTSIKIGDDAYALGDNANISAHTNNLSGSVVGVANVDGYTGSVDATNNWWGAISGPTAAQVSGSVTYTNWCVNVSCTADTTGPVITLNGSSSVSLTEGDPYVEEGATATDANDGTVAVTISGTVDTSIADVYTVTYTATDASGNVSTKTRTVDVSRGSSRRSGSGGGSSSSSSTGTATTGTNDTTSTTGNVNTTGSVLGASTFNFTTDLKFGVKGEGVSQLQQMLIDGGFLKIGSPTGWYGPLTKAAVAKWQSANGISPALGYFGPISRAAYKAMLTTSVTTPSTI